ncbi:MAG: hypothetical protein WC047_08305, partial [Kiritimatiellales bacterium]
FIYGYVRQWPLKKAAQLGAVVAAYAIEHVGTQEHFFTQAEIIQRYQAHFGKDLHAEDFN